MDSVDKTEVDMRSSSPWPSGVVAGVVMTVWEGVAVVEVVVPGTEGFRPGDAG